MESKETGMKKIAPILRELESGESTEYPLKRYDSVVQTIQRLRRQGLSFTTTISDDIVIVTKLHG